ncbi:MAG TPA: Type 1 glutamine amidotransferase-like domain-containing protein [Rhizomicrobium sp.]|jgi:dipeptidase E
MKLYLSSYMIGDHADRLLAMAGHNARMAIITNALDAFPMENRFQYTRTVFDPVEYFLGQGFDPELVDLRYYFGRAAALRESLRRYKIVWALGGNTFLLRRAMRESGFDSFIAEMLRDEGIIYGGWSAGACVAAPSLRGIALMDEPEAMADGYSSRDIVWEGLDLVPFSIVPHVQSNHPESALASKAVSYLESRGLPYQPLRDGDVVMKDGGDVTVLLAKPN